MVLKRGEGVQGVDAVVGGNSREEVERGRRLSQVVCGGGCLVK